MIEGASAQGFAGGGQISIVTLKPQRTASRSPWCAARLSSFRVYRACVAEDYRPNDRSTARIADYRRLT
jgi:hypothetical protein